MRRKDTPVDDRRRDDRRSDFVRLADYAVPELRRGILTAVFLLGILVLLGYMVVDVIVAIVAGIVLGVYLIPFHDWLAARLRMSRLAAILSITLVTVPLLAILIYSWVEISEAAAYLDANRGPVAARLTAALHRLPFADGFAVQDDLSRFVETLNARTGEVVGEIQEAIGLIGISIAVFLFTVFYVLTDHVRIIGYILRKIPGQYRSLANEVGRNMQAVVYGALYATFLTQLMKSSVILAMNMTWGVPLGVVLAIASFFIGFFPIVGSWTVYLPVAIYVIVFRNDVIGGVAMLLIGFFGITLFMSMYLRPKIAAEKSRVLNFYWMFIALVTGVYTFGLVGIIIGPVLIGVLKALFDTVTGDAVPALVDTTRPETHGRAAAG